MTTAQLSTPEQHAAFIGGFDDAAFARIGEAQPILRAKREEAFEAYAGLAVPTARDEEWRRTDPALFPFASFQAPARLHMLPGVEPRAGDEQFDVVVAVGDGGYAIRDVSGALKAGRFAVLSLSDAATRHPDVVRRHLRGPARVKGPRKFTALNDAFWNVGLFIHVPADTAVEKGILIRYHHRAPGAQVPRLLIVVEDRCSLKVAEHYESAEDAALLSVGSREMYIGAGSSLKIVSLQEWGGETLYLGEDWAHVGRDAKIDWVTMLLGGKMGKMMVGCDANAPNANAYMSGLFFAEGRQHMDLRTLQLHSAPNTYSNLLYKGAVKDQGHSVYQGIIDAAPGAIKVDAYQMNNNLVLNDGARADSLPGLEIDADDLKCSHGATMGNLDPAQIFYLQSRGLAAAEARQLLVMGFFEEIIDRVPYAFMQERVRAHVKRKMG